MSETRRSNAYACVFFEQASWIARFPDQTTHSTPDQTRQISTIAIQNIERLLEGTQTRRDDASVHLANVVSDGGGEPSRSTSVGWEKREEMPRPNARKKRCDNVCRQIE